MLAVIDCAVQEPVPNCFNSIVEQYAGPCFYHCPAFCEMNETNTLPQAVIILGSASSVNDKLDWQNKLYKHIEKFVEAKLPILGLCYGHQALAHFFGAEVSFISKDQIKLKGSREIRFLKAFGEIKENERLRVAVSHREEIKKLPQDLKTLASSEKISVEAFQHQSLPVFGFQSHPEASTYFLKNNLGFTDDSEIQELRQSGGRIIQAFLSLAFK